MELDSRCPAAVPIVLAALARTRVTALAMAALARKGADAFAAMSARLARKPTNGQKMLLIEK
jgi:hypothetical protein